MARMLIQLQFYCVEGEKKNIGQINVYMNMRSQLNFYYNIISSMVCYRINYANYVILNSNRNVKFSFANDLSSKVAKLIVMLIDFNVKFLKKWTTSKFTSHTVTISPYLRTDYQLPIVRKSMKDNHTQSNISFT